MTEHWSDLEACLRLVLAQLQNFMLHSPCSKQHCCVEGVILKPLKTLLNLKPYTQSALVADTNSQNRILCELLSLIANLCIGCREAQVLLSADSAKETPGILLLMLWIQTVPCN